TCCGRRQRLNDEIASPQVRDSRRETTRVFVSKRDVSRRPSVEEHPGIRRSRNRVLEPTARDEVRALDRLYMHRKTRASFKHDSINDHMIALRNPYALAAVGAYVPTKDPRGVRTIDRAG